MALTGQITSQLTWTQYNENDIGIQTNSNNETYVFNFTSGSGWEGIDMIWYGSFTGDQNLNLSALPQTWFEGVATLNFSSGRVKGVIVDNLTTGMSGSITLPFELCSGTVDVAPSGKTVLGNMFGWYVNENDTIEISTSSLSGYRVGIIGHSDVYIALVGIAATSGTSSGTLDT